MASPKEIPELTTEFVAMAKEYVKQETIEPAKKLGRLAAFSFAGAILFVLAAILLTIAGARTLIDVLPDGALWSGLGYIIAGVAALVVTGLVMWRAGK